jgi:hypothetical protein
VRTIPVCALGSKSAQDRLEVSSGNSAFLIKSGC